MVAQSPIIRIGIIGCGEIAQVAHIPTLTFLSSKVAGSKRPSTTLVAEELCQSAHVDAVIVCNSDAFHVPHAILALKNDKHVFVEKPLALCQKDIEALATAEQASKRSVFVGYMRRYASAFQDAIEEIGGTDEIQYVRVRDIIGPNSMFVGQSGTFPAKFTDFSPEAVDALSKREEDMMQVALCTDIGVPVTNETKRFLRVLGGLGSHDLSAMREIIGLPKSVLAARLQLPIWQALFDYGHFCVTYESGLNAIPLFDASIEIFTASKTVTIKYDTPYVKGPPTTMIIRERVGESGFQERLLRSTYEDPYTKELLEWYQCMTTGKKPKTSVEDAREDLTIFKMLMKAGFSPGS